MADGNLYRKNSRYRVQIRLNKKDISVLEFIKNEIVPNHNINFFYKEREITPIDSAFLLFEHKQITLDLLKLGIFPRKTGYEHIPSILPKEYWNSFILGYLDGDGSIKKVKRKDYFSYSITFTSASKKILEQIQSHFNIGKIYKYSKENSNVPVYNLDISIREEIEKFYEETYQKIDHFTLDRKRNRLKEFIDRGRLDSEYLTVFGEKIKISDLAKKFDINNRTLRSRLSNEKLKHLSIEEIVNLPKNYRV